jgi:hypothetical protein
MAQDGGMMKEKGEKGRRKGKGHHGFKVVCPLGHAPLGCMLFWEGVMVLWEAVRETKSLRPFAGSRNFYYASRLRRDKFSKP